MKQLQLTGRQIFRYSSCIILPQLKSVTITVIILQGVSVWNEYTYSYYFLQKTEMRTITLVIKTFFSAVSNDYGAAAATAVTGGTADYPLFVPAEIFHSGTGGQCH